MSEFERFGLICEEWLDAAKEEEPKKKTSGITSVSWTGSVYATATPSIVASS